MKHARTTMPSRRRVTVVGASGTIGAEVARLAVAFGAEVVGVTRRGRPAVDEPWVHGVRWIARDMSGPDALSDLTGDALIVASNVRVPVGAAEQFDRVVVVRAVDDVDAQGEGVIVARPRAVDATPMDSAFDVAGAGETMRVETLAMALLRAALDEGIGAVLEHEDLAYLGDAVMLQG